MSHGLLKIECGILPCCSNLVCHGCIAQWLHDHTACPLCQTELSIESVVNLPNSYQLTSMLTFMEEMEKDVIELQ